MDAKTFDRSKLPGRQFADGAPRLNVPAAVMYGGSITPIKLKGHRLARRRAATHAAGKAEVVCYADN
jgi:hypothetical protein